MHEADLAVLLLRVAAGLTMAYHGYNKTKGLVGTSKWFESMGMQPGAVHARLAAFTEIGGGLALAAGLLTPFAGAAFVGLMLVEGVAPFDRHRPAADCRTHPFAMTSPSRQHRLIGRFLPKSQTELLLEAHAT